MRGAVAGYSLGHLAAFIQQRIRHIYRGRRPTPLASRSARAICSLTHAIAGRPTPEFALVRLGKELVGGPSSSHG
jgi:hypothetical protein